MELVNPITMLRHAQNQGYAVAAFNVHNLETVQAVAEAAYREQAPVIIQTTPGTLKHAGAAYIVACARAAAKCYRVPIALHLDHCESFDIIVKCIQEGYTSVMIDGSKLPYEDNVALVHRVVEIGKITGVAVEAELGRIGGTEDSVTVVSKDALLTDPQEALEFVEATGIDTIAIAIGTAHGFYQGEPNLDFPRLAAIREKVALPLVLHGASGIGARDLQAAIRGGICKVNIATELKVPMAAAIRQVFAANPKELDPRVYMGKAKQAVREVAQEKIRVCGSSRKARKIAPCC